MASPVYPTVPPPVRQRPRRSLAGPAVLIILGIVFLMGTMGVLNWGSLGHIFAHYWPLLLILWGVVKFLEYRQAERDGVRPAGIGAGGIFLLIFLIALGLTATQTSRLNWGAIRDEMDINIDNGDFPMFGHTYTYDDRIEQEFPAGGSLQITNDRGAVTVSASDDNKIHVNVHKRVNADKEEDGQKYNAGTKTLIAITGTTVSLNAKTHGAGDHWVVADLEVSLPRKASVSINARRGDVSIMGRDGDVQVTNQKSDVSVSDINGKVDLSLEHSSARVSQISSDVSVDGHINDISIDDVKGTLRLNGDFVETLKLSKLAKATTFKTSRTEMEFTKLDGDLELDSGDLRASNITGPVRLSTRSKDIVLDGVTGDVRLKDENGAVEVHMAKAGSMQVENRNGDIQIYLPDKTAFHLEARTRDGEVQSDFEQLQTTTSGNETSVVGTIGTGGPQLVLTNEHGTIEVRKRSVVAMSAPESEKLPPAPKAPKAPKAPAAETPEVSDN
ncbi:MAG TPA: DUF4097 family beta strand repeat-containing protein [Terriglobales bacterium]|nr:DUF4097 family beta strand repeat-containing protein [Terriglobales bacterium]